MVKYQDSAETDFDYDLRRAFPDYVEYFDNWSRRSFDARQIWSPQLDIPYGDGNRERMDLFVPSKPCGATVFFVHGGYWRSLDKSDFSFVAVPYVKRGIGVALINYSLFPGTTMATVVNQVERACHCLTSLRDASECCNAVHLVGWSAGAHLVAMLTAGLNSMESASPLRTKIRSMLGISGIYDLEPLLFASGNRDLRLDRETARQFSPIHLKPPDKFRVSLVWGSSETNALCRQSEDFAEAWANKGAQLSSTELPNAHHYAAMNALADEDGLLFSISQTIIGV